MRLPGDIAGLCLSYIFGGSSRGSGYIGKTPYAWAAVFRSRQVRRKLRGLPQAIFKGRPRFAMSCVPQGNRFGPGDFEWLSRKEQIDVGCHLQSLSWGT